MPRKCKRKSETHACEKEEKQRITRRAASMVEVIITDGRVDPEQVAAVENCGVRLILV